MPKDRDFKKLVRAHMQRTGEPSYQKARDALLAQGRESGGTMFHIAVDGRIAAENPLNAGIIGYGPSEQFAVKDLLECIQRRLPHPPLYGLGARANVLTLRRESRRCTARATEDLALIGEGASEEEAAEALLAKLPPRHGDRFTRTVWLMEIEQGQWMARAEGAGHFDGLMGWGATANEAEERLLEQEQRLAVRAVLLPEERRAIPDEFGLTYVVVVDGRLRATNPEDNRVGYGPSEEWARRNIAHGRERRNTLTLSRHPGMPWTARATQDLDITAEGETDWQVEEALRVKLGVGHTDCFTRTVWLEEHDDGRWSARAEGLGHFHGLLAWGATANEAEANLLDDEDAGSFRYESFEDYGSYKD